MESISEKAKAEKYVRRQIPELMELSFGCEIKIATPKRYAEFDDVGETKAVTVFYAEQRGFDDTDIFHHVWLTDYNEHQDISSYDEDEFEIIGHPIQLQHWLRVAPASYGYVKSAEHIGLLHKSGSIPVWFDLTTGQPATEADYKAFNTIVGI